MSIAALKTLLFGPPKSPRLLPGSSNHGYGTSQTKHRTSSTASSATTLSDDDLEAQHHQQQQPHQPLIQKYTSPSPSPSPSTTDGGGFRITARVISDATIGLSDGLTVPFALTAGLSALGSARVVVYGGLAELIAGAISMGLGGYLGAKSEQASYAESRLRVAAAVAGSPRAEAERSLRAVFAPYGGVLPDDVLAEAAARMVASAGPEGVVDFVSRIEQGAEDPGASRPLTSALTIATGYFVGGLVPLLPYLFVAEVMVGLWISVAVMAVALFSFGYVKTCIVTGWEGGRCVRMGLFGGAQMVVVGGAAAGAAMGLVKLFDALGGR